MSSMMIIKSKAERGFWRAGLHFTREAREVDATTLTKEQLTALRDEPNLIIAEKSETTAAVKKAAK